MKHLLPLFTICFVLTGCFYNDSGDRNENSSNCSDCSTSNENTNTSEPNTEDNISSPSNNENPTTQQSFDLLKVSGNDSDLLEGSYSSLSASALDNQGTQSLRRIHQGGFGYDSRCGLDGEVVKVTNLNDSGPGSLRSAVSLPEPRTIVFEVSGAIRLSSPLVIESPFITIAGHTAPAPGVSLYHSSLRVHTHDVCIQHIRVRRGDLDSNSNPIPAQEAQDADTVVIRGGRDPEGTYNVTLDNVSISWSIDEAVAVFSGVSNLTIRDSIIGEPLRFNAHGRNHAYCLFIKNEARRVSLIGNIFTQCQRRSPRMDGGTLQYVNNLVYNPGEYALHAHNAEINVTMLGNSLEFPSDSSNRWDENGPNEFFTSRTHRAKVFNAENKVQLEKQITGNHTDGSPVEHEISPSVWEGNVLALTPKAMRSSITDWVGAFPRHRDSVDRRLITDIKSKRGSYTDSQSDVGGYPFIEENYRALDIPNNPRGDDDSDGVSNLAEWLKEFLYDIE